MSRLLSSLATQTPMLCSWAVPLSTSGRMRGWGGGGVYVVDWGSGGRECIKGGSLLYNKGINNILALHIPVNINVRSSTSSGA